MQVQLEKVVNKISYLNVQLIFHLC